MGTIKDRNDMELTEAEDIKKRWQYKYRANRLRHWSYKNKKIKIKKKKKRRGGRNTQKNYTKKFLMAWISMMVWSHT